MKLHLLSSIALITASISTQAITTIDEIEHYFGAGLAWHELSDTKSAKDTVILAQKKGVNLGMLQTAIAKQSSVSGIINGSTLDEKRQIQFSVLMGTRAFFNHGFFIGFEGQVSKTNQAFSISTQVNAIDTKNKPATVALLSTINQNEIALGTVPQVVYHTNIDNKYTLAANVPIGIRVDIPDDLSIDLYGIIAYQYSKYTVYPSMSVNEKKSPFDVTRTPAIEKLEDFNLHGFKYGVGVDLNIQNFKIGARYTINQLDKIPNENRLKNTPILSRHTKDNNISINVSYLF